MDTFAAASDKTNQHYVELVNLFYLMLDGQKGIAPPDPRWVQCHELAIKLFYHACSIHDLRQGTRVPLPALEGGANFFDFASVTVLTRAALEAYLTMFEVFFEPASDDLFVFRHALWNLAGAILRAAYEPNTPGLEHKVAEAVSYAQELRATIAATITFQTLKRGQQADVMKGNRLRGSMVDRARAAGFGEKTLKFVWDYYSGFVHSDGASVAQVVAAKSREQQLLPIEIQMRLVLMVLGLTIIRFSKHFPAAQAICAANLDAYRRAESYAMMAGSIG